MVESLNLMKYVVHIKVCGLTKLRNLIIHIACIEAIITETWKVRVNNQFLDLVERLPLYFQIQIDT